MPFPAPPLFLLNCYRAEQVCRTRRLNDGAIVLFGSVNVDMMFIDDKSFRDDVKPLIDFDGKFLIAFREQIGKFLFGKTMIDDTGRKPVQISFTFSFSFGTPVRGDHNFCDFRLLKIFLNPVFRFVEEVKDGHLPIFSGIKRLF